MNTLRQAAQQALEAIDLYQGNEHCEDAFLAAGDALRKALEQPEQEPVAWICYGAPGKRDIDFEESDIDGLPIGTSLYTTPPAAQRPWAELTASTILNMMPSSIPAEYDGALMEFARDIEAKLKEQQ
jgi:hypothetical protein